MGMINGRYTTSAEDKRVLKEELDTMRFKFNKILSFVEDEFPLGRPFDYMGMEMCTTSIDVTAPRGVASCSREDAEARLRSGFLLEIPTVRPAYNAEGKIVLNCEYINPVTGLFTTKSFGSEHFMPRSPEERLRKIWLRV